MREGEELVETPFQRLIEADQLLAFKHEGFWRPMDTLKDRQVLEDLVEQGTMPWRLGGAPLARLRREEAGRDEASGAWQERASGFPCSASAPVRTTSRLAPAQPS